MDIQNTIKIKFEAKRLFMNKLEELIKAELSPKDETMDYSKMKWEELTKIYKERKIINSSKMRKQGMIEKLNQFDKDPPKQNEENIYSNLSHKELVQICQKRKNSSALQMTKKKR